MDMTTIVAGAGQVVREKVKQFAQFSVTNLEKVRCGFETLTVESRSTHGLPPIYSLTSSLCLRVQWLPVPAVQDRDSGRGRHHDVRGAGRAQKDHGDLLQGRSVATSRGGRQAMSSCATLIIDWGVMQMWL